MSKKETNLGQTREFEASQGSTKTAARRARRAAARTQGKPEALEPAVAPGGGATSSARTGGSGCGAPRSGEPLSLSHVGRCVDEVAEADPTGLALWYAWSTGVLDPSALTGNELLRIAELALVFDRHLVTEPP